MTWRREISIQQLGWRLFALAFVPALLVKVWLYDLWMPAANTFVLPAESHRYLTTLVRGTALSTGGALFVAFALSSVVTQYNLRKYDIYKDLEEEVEVSRWRKCLGKTWLIITLFLIVSTIYMPFYLAIHIYNTQFNSIESIIDISSQFTKSARSLFNLTCMAAVGWPLLHQSRVDRTHYLPKGVQDVR